MKIFLRATLIIALLCTSLLSFSQTKGTVSGRIVNSKDKTPIDYATIAIKSLTDSSVVATGQTATDGTFKFTNIPVGKYRAMVAYLGLKNASKNFELVSVKTPVILAI